MYTIEEIYNRLNDGTEGTKRSGAFTESNAVPASTGKTLDDVMSRAKWATDGDAFLGVQSSNSYWSSSISLILTAYAWYVDLGYSSVTSSNKANTNYVWPVQGFDFLLKCNKIHMSVTST
ncbi:hypothetical protein [Candidatus Marithrix sp. Canyon 246]|uniref:hypothetical protein n=1 Tax=Candidatus Marithrix sp. Canyon 246 TaxID=1827136 RepID=UPI00084A223D|nr:hypothetical protein [Candidatus Marithrix sp. Canyon 246]